MADTGERPYKVSDVRKIVDSGGVRVQVFTLSAGEKVPWHYHTNITDTFVCIEGPMVVETRGPRAIHELAPGDILAVPPKTPHEVQGRDGGPCQFTIVQAVGEYDFVPIGPGSRDGDGA